MEVFYFNYLKLDKYLNLYFELCLVNDFFLHSFLLLFFKSFLFSQSTDSLIKIIKTKYLIIQNNIESYDTISKEEWEGSTEGGRVTGYYKNKDLKLIKGVYFGETGKTETEYYFDDNILIFVFEKNYIYNRPIYWDKKHAQENGDSVTFDHAKTITAEKGLYYYKEKLIRWVYDKRSEANLSVYSNSLFGESLLAHAYKLRQVLKKK